MRILQIIQRPQLRGAEIFACQLSAHLTRRGHACKVVALYPGDAPMPFEVDTRFIATHPRVRWFDVVGWWRLYRLIKTYKPDIVQANAADTLKYAVLSKLFFRWKPPVVFRNANLMSGFLTTPVKWKLNIWLVNQVGHVISVSTACSRDLTDRLGINPDRISTVEIGIEVNEVTEKGIDRASIAASIREQFAVPQNSPLLISVAGFVPEKNHEGLIRIFARIRSSVPQAHLLLVGRGPLLDKVRDQVMASGLSDAVHFAGVRSDVMNLLLSSEVMVMPSLIEGLPGVILEAMYARCPVVAYAAGGIPDVLRDQENGRLIPVGDEGAFARAAVDLIMRNQPPEPLVDRAFDAVVSRFNNSKIAERFEGIFLKLLNSESPSSGT